MLGHYAVRESRDLDFLKAIRTMLRRDDLTADAAYAAVPYLWNLDTPEAVDGLREVYDRGLSARRASSMAEALRGVGGAG